MCALHEVPHYLDGVIITQITKNTDSLFYSKRIKNINQQNIL